jgi:hypothetical protein
MVGQVGERVSGIGEEDREEVGGWKWEEVDRVGCDQVGGYPSIRDYTPRQ